MAATTEGTCESKTLSQTTEDEADEWLFSSINDYSDLYMYEFQYATRCMTWVSVDKLCVACLLPEKRSEILEMILPERLLAETEDKQNIVTLHPKNAAGRQTLCVNEPLFLFRKVVTAEKGENLIRFWQLGNEDYDVIEKVDEVKNSEPDSGPACLSLTGDGQSCLFGSTLRNVQEISLETLQEKWLASKTTNSISDKSMVCGIEYLNQNVFAACGRHNGNIYIFDKRQSSGNSTVIPAPPNTHIPCVFSTSVSGESSAMFASLDSQGTVTLWDSRCTKQHLHHVNTEMQNTRGDTLQIQFSRNNASTLSVSGFDGNIYIYETSKWPESNSGCPVVKPSFVHRGHEVCLEEDFKGTLTVLHHSWHLSQSTLILSAASDGSLHAWNYSEQTEHGVAPSSSCHSEFTGKALPVSHGEEGSTANESGDTKSNLL